MRVENMQLTIIYTANYSGYRDF